MTQLIRSVLSRVVYAEKWATRRVCIVLTLVPTWLAIVRLASIATTAPRQEVAPPPGVAVVGVVLVAAAATELVAKSTAAVEASLRAKRSTCKSLEGYERGVLGVFLRPLRHANGADLRR